jgi:plasmid stability protein
MSRLILLFHKMRGMLSRQTLIGDVEPSFDTLAADLRKLTRRRQQTPSEVLLREGRKER